MTPTVRFGVRWRTIVGVCAAAVALGACAGRQSQPLPVAPVAAGIVWTIDDGDVIRTKVYRASDLDAEAQVDLNGRVFFPGIGRLDVRGITLDSLETLLNARYSTLVRTATVQVTMQRDITLYGQLRAPGVYGSGPGSTLLALIARAGGPSSNSGSPEMTLQKADGRQLALPREARLGSLDLRHGDAIYVVDNSFFVRHQTSIQATTLVATLLSTVIGIVFLLTK